MSPTGMNSMNKQPHPESSFLRPVKVISGRPRARSAKYFRKYFPPPMTYNGAYPLYPVTRFPVIQPIQPNPGCDSFDQTAKLQESFIQQCQGGLFESLSNRRYSSSDGSISGSLSGSANNGREHRPHFSSSKILNNCASTSATKDPSVNAYYEKDPINEKILQGTSKLLTLCEEFEHVVVDRFKRARANKPPPPTYKKRNIRRCKCCCPISDSGRPTESGEDTDKDDLIMEELERKNNDPDILHPELRYNDPGEMNGGPLCRNSSNAKKCGIRPITTYPRQLGVYNCDKYSNNADKLYHYKITVSPSINFLDIETPTVIVHDQHELKYMFEGFSMFTHEPLQNVPECKFIRYNREYKLFLIKDKLPEHFIIRELNLFHKFLFNELLELVDFDFKVAGDAEGCSMLHFMPRFVRESPETGKELLSMNEVLLYLLKCSKQLFPLHNLYETVNLPENKWQSMVDEVKGMIVTYPGKKPCSLRVDQLNKDQSGAKKGEIKVPEIMHLGIRPSKLYFNRNPEKNYIKLCMSKSSIKDKMKKNIKNMRTLNSTKGRVTVDISGDGFYKTGIMCDIVQHAMLIPVVVSHLEFHKSLDVIYNNRSSLQLPLTHPSYCKNFGMNPDHVRNCLSNCGIRQPVYGKLLPRQ